VPMSLRARSLPPSLPCVNHFVIDAIDSVGFSEE
jgi:hypothetical protein